jgi:hypothetical protein
MGCGRGYRRPDPKSKNQGISRAHAAWISDLPPETLDDWRFSRERVRKVTPEESDEDDQGKERLEENEYDTNSGPLEKKTA